MLSGHCEETPLLQTVKKEEQLDASSPSQSFSATKMTSSTQMSNRETEVTETSTQPQKSNKITSFFAKLVSWSSRDNLTNETKHNSQKKKRLAFFKSKSQEGKKKSNNYSNSKGASMVL